MLPHVERSRVGTVVNSILYLTLGYHMVFKVVRLKKGERRLWPPLQPLIVSSVA